MSACGGAVVAASEGEEMPVPEIPADQAVAMMTKRVEDELAWDELLEIHNELFPKHQASEEEAQQHRSVLVQRLVERITAWAAIENFVDVWGMLFPRHRNVWYNEEDKTLHYNEDSEAVEVDWP
jgi:hypothetical protein